MPLRGANWGAHLLASPCRMVTPLACNDTLYVDDDCGREELTEAGLSYKTTENALHGIVKYLAS